NRIAYVPGATATVTADQAVSGLRRVRPRVLLTTLELPAPALSALYREARSLGATVVAHATPEPSEGREGVASADVLIVDEAEASELLSLGGGDRDWQGVARMLLELGPRAAIVTIGEAGAVVAGQGISELLPAPRVKVVDSTGAGDAFCGAFGARVAGGADLL